MRGKMNALEGNPSRAGRRQTKRMKLFQPAFAVGEVNSTGAGDAFTSALIYSLLNGWEVDHSPAEVFAEVLLRAQATGAVKATKWKSSGVQAKEVERLLLEQGDKVLSSPQVRLRESPETLGARTLNRERKEERPILTDWEVVWAFQLCSSSLHGEISLPLHGVANYGRTLPDSKRSDTPVGKPQGDP